MADGTKDGIGEWIRTIFWALLIAGVFRTLFFQPFFIPSGSMKDTLLIGDFIFVNKMAYGYSRYSCPFAICPISGRILAAEPERGDVVVFRNPSTNQDFIKRLIGLPGDKIQMKDGVAYLNGEALPQEPAGTFEEIFEPQGAQARYPTCINGPVGEGATCKAERFIETLPNGRKHAVLNTKTSPSHPDNTPVYTVPEGHYFFMGDNRDNSQDSRYPASNGGVGMLPADHLIGRADRIVFSSAGKRLLFFWTWRSDRFFKAVE